MDALRRAGCIALVVLLGLGCSGSGAAPLEGRVVEVLDGDSFVMRGPGGDRVEVRIGEIDAPEGGQAHGDISRRKLAALLDGARVRLDVQAIDDYGRTVGRPYVDTLDVAAELVRTGDAWVYRRYLKDPTLPELERQAKAAGQGLWSLPEAQRVPPWEWRQQARGQARAQARPSARPPAGQGATQDDPRCRIKGNINGRGERIYHLPGQEHYEDTRVSVSRGERWFCSETEARDAGWRPARR